MHRQRRAVIGERLVGAVQESITVIICCEDGFADLNKRIRRRQIAQITGYHPSDEHRPKRVIERRLESLVSEGLSYFGIDYRQSAIDGDITDIVVMPVFVR